jgi:signal transduction histidine kinase
MTRRLLASYVGLTAIVLLALGVPLAITYQHDAQHDRTLQMQAGAAALATLVDDTTEGTVAVAAPALARQSATQLRARMVIIDEAGRVLADAGGRGPLSPFLPNLQQARSGHVATGEAGGQLYAIALTSGGGHVLAVYPSVGVNATVRRYWLMIGLFAAVALVVACLIGLVLARSVARPLKTLERAAVQAGEGHLEGGVPESGPPELRSLAHSFNVASGKLNALLESQAAWVSDAAHQLRTPLAALRLRLENLQSQAPDADGDDLEAALYEVDRLTVLTDNLLTLSKLETEPGSPGSVDVGSLTSERVEMWSALAEEQHVAVRAEVGDRVVARSRPGALEQVLDNLLANALDATPAGCAIAVTADRADGWVELHVVDQGPGLTPEEREHAFDRFWSGRRASGHEGSGLGLAIVRRLVEADQGTVSLEPARSGGCDAVVRLPAAG